MTQSKHTIADYGDFEVHLKKSPTSNKETIKKISEVEIKFRRKRQMVDKGLLSKAAAAKIEAEYNAEMIRVFADNMVVGWKGKFQGEELPEFNRENVVNFFSKKSNQIILVDLVEVYLSSEVDEDVEEEIKKVDSEIQEEEIKN